jgi:dTMP kinase
MDNSFFLVIEGNEGSGKSTISKVLNNRLKHLYNTCLTREPGGIQTAEEIREVILKDRNKQIEGLTEAFLFAAARSEHIEKKVKPALKRKEIVIMDRYYYSSLAYQGYGRQLGFDRVKKINQPFIDNAKPDLAIFLDVKEDIRLKRLNKRAEKNRLDLESKAFAKRVDYGYKKCEEIFDEFIFINANKSINEVVEDILDLMELKKRRSKKCINA